MDHPHGARGWASTKICSKDEWAVQRGRDRVVAGERLLPQFHRQADVDGVAVLPDSSHGKIGSRIGHRFDQPAVDLDLRVFGRPARNTNVDGPRSRPRGLDFERRALLPGELRDLLEHKAFVLPIERGCNELVDINVAATTEINRVAKLGEFLGAGAGAAPERFLGRVVRTPIAGGEREEILLETLRVLRAQPAVE